MLIITVPDALRTKYEPDVEKEEERLTMQANTIPVEAAQVKKIFKMLFF